MSKLEQTKGMFKLVGKTNIEKIETKDFGWIQKTNMSVKTLKDNFVQVLFESKNGKGMGVKVKGVDDKEATKVNIDGAVDKLKTTFTNDSMVCVMGVTEYDSYNKKMTIKPSGVYSSNSDYDQDDFEETNFVEHDFIFSNYEGKKATVLYVSFFGEVSELEFSVSDELDEDFKSFKYGDCLKVVYSIINKPNYVDDSSSNFVPKGKGVHNNGKRNIDGYIEDLIIVGLKDVIKSKYSRQEVRDAIEEFDKKQAEYKEQSKNKVETKKEDVNSNTTASEDDDLPY